MTAETLRKRYATSFKANSAFIEHRAPSAQTFPWSTPGAMIGSACISAVEHALIALAAGDARVAGICVRRGRELVNEAWGRFDGRSENWMNGPEIALSDRAIRVLAGESGSNVAAVPFQAFRDCLSSDEMPREVKDGARLYWSLFALIEDEQAEFEEAATRYQRRQNRELENELKLIPGLPSCAKHRDAVEWSQFGLVLARWLDPSLRTKSYAEVFRSDFALLLSIFWLKYRLGSQSPEDLVATWVGETLENTGDG